jgi:hypothetical protein
MVVTGVPGIPVPPGSVRAECHRCEKEVKIAPSTKQTLEDDPTLPLLCWRCVKVLLPEYAVEKPIFTGVKEGRRLRGMPD